MRYSFLDRKANFSLNFNDVFDTKPEETRERSYGEQADPHLEKKNNKNKLQDDVGLCTPTSSGVYNISE